jgi:hypothetical protein
VLFCTVLYCFVLLFLALGQHRFCLFCMFCLFSPLTTQRGFESLGTAMAMDAAAAEAVAADAAAAPGLAALAAAMNTPVPGGGLRSGKLQ